MAGRGPAPKDPAKRRRANVSAVPTTKLVEDGLVRGPELPDSMEWPTRTRCWWETWQRSPQAASLTATDWDFLLDTALLHAELWSGNGSVASELRLRVAKFGATPEDRARLRMQVDEPEKSAEPKQSRYQHLKVIGDA